MKQPLMKIFYELTLIVFLIILSLAWLYLFTSGHIIVIFM